MKKIVFIINSRSEIGGVERMLFSWLEFIDLIKTRVYIIIRSGNFSNELYKRYKHINIIISPNTKKREIPALFLFRTIVKIQPHICFFVGSWPFAFNALQILIGRLLSKKVLYSIHNPFNELEDNRTKPRKYLGLFRGFGLWKKLKKLDKFFSFIFSDKVFVVSKTIEKYLLVNKLTRKSKIKIVYHGVKRNFLNQDKRIITKKCVITAASRFVQQKRIDRLLAAFLWFCKHYTDFENYNEIILQIAGEGEKFDYYIKKVNKFPLNIKNRIKFLGFSKNMDDIWQQTNFSICTSDFEGFGLVIMESMAAGNIPILGNWLGMADYVTENEDCILVKRKTPFAFAKAIAEAVSLDENKRNEMMNNAIKNMQNNFNLETNIRRFLIEASIPSI